MKSCKILPNLLFSVLFLVCSQLAKTQNMTPDWGKLVYNTSGGGYVARKTIATDKYGNVYFLGGAGHGKITADTQATADSTATEVLVSWDCNGNFRWMKTLGTTAVGGQNTGYYLVADTLGGIYICGYAQANQTNSTIYWDADTSINMTAGNRAVYLAKYNSQGQFQWLQTLDSGSLNIMGILGNGFSVTPDGQVYWVALLQPGSYNGGNFSITIPNYYAIRYDANGNYLATIPMDMTLPASGSKAGKIRWELDPADSRFYAYLFYDTTFGGNLVIGNTTLTAATGTGNGKKVLAAFDNNGHNIWVQQGSLNSGGIAAIAFDKQGTIYLSGISDTGSVFCGDTVVNNSLNNVAFLMAIDTNANLLWANHSVKNDFIIVNDINVLNNIIISSGGYIGNLVWNNLTINNPVWPNYMNGYVLRANAVTGNVLQLEDIDATNGPCLVYNAVIDPNSNIYVRSIFNGDLVFANTTSSVTYSSDILLKYKNVVCGCDLLQPSFTFSNTTGSLGFQYTYTGGAPYTSISWDFGDGSPASSIPNPSHTYAAPGTYAVCVTATNSCGSNTNCKYVTVHPTDVREADAFSSIAVYPNPAYDKIMVVNLPKGTTVEVVDIMGRTVKTVITSHSELSINITELSPGVHLLRFTDKAGRNGSRVFIKG